MEWLCNSYHFASTTTSMTELRPHLPREFLAKLIAEPCMKDKTSFIFSKGLPLHSFKTP